LIFGVFSWSGNLKKEWHQEVSGSIPLISTNKKASNHYDLKPFSCFWNFFAHICICQPKPYQTTKSGI